MLYPAELQRQIYRKNKYLFSIPVTVIKIKHRQWNIYANYVII